MKNKGIIILGGKLNAKNIVVGDNATIIHNQKPEKEKVILPPEKVALITGWKDEIAKGNLKEVITLLLQHFKEEGNKEILNAIIMNSSSLSQLQLQENLGLITHEQAKVDKAKVINCILQIIDDNVIT